MRKISLEMARNLVNGNNKVKSNSEVFENSLYLFNNEIARYVNGRLEITLFYTTMTTFERLNAVLAVVFNENFKLRNRAGKLYFENTLTGKKIYFVGARGYDIFYNPREIFMDLFYNN